jgi:hypothetical protein
MEISAGAVKVHVHQIQRKQWIESFRDISS